jgi:hypothetical protein
MADKIVGADQVVFMSGRRFGKSQAINTLVLIRLLKTNGIDLEDALFYLGAYLQDQQEVTEYE